MFSDIRRTAFGLQLVRGRNVKKAFPSDPDFPDQPSQSDEEDKNIEDKSPLIGNYHSEITNSI